MASSTEARVTGYLGILRSQPILLPMLSIVACVMLGMGMVAPVLALYAESFGVSLISVGLIITVFGLARFLIDIPAGTFAERHGRRLLLWGGPLLMAAASVGAALADNFTALLVWRFLQGAGSGIYLTGTMVALIDISTPQTRGRVMALHQTAILVGAGMGPSLGGSLAERFGYQAPFWAFAGVAAIATVIAFFGFAETHSAAAREAAKQSGFREDMAVLFGSLSFLAIAFVSFGTFFTRTAGSWDMIPLVASNRFAMQPETIGWALTTSALANLACLPIAGALIDRYGTRPSIIGATATNAIALLLIAVAPAPIFFWLGMMLLGAGTGIGGPATASAAADAAPVGKVGPAMGALRAVSDLGFVIGPLLVGAFVEATPFGYAGGLVLNGVLVAASAGLAAVALKGGRRI